MAYTQDWDETVPIDHTKFKQQPGFVRDTKSMVAERLAIMLYGFTSGETDKGFKFAQFKDQAGDAGTPSAGFLRLYTKIINSLVSKLFVVNSAGTVSEVGIDNQSSDLASASTTDLSTATGKYVTITGTTSITAFGTSPVGTRRIIKFSGILTLTHNATSLIIPGGKNIITSAGDYCKVLSLGSGNWQVEEYIYKDRPCFSVHKNGTNQTGIVTAVLTTLTWPTEEYDSNGNFASDAWTPTVAGKYRLFCEAQFTVGADQTQYGLVLYKNGSIYKQGPQVQCSGAGLLSVSVDAIVEANGSTDTFLVKAVQNSGSDKIINGSDQVTFFQGHFLRP